MFNRFFICFFALFLTLGGFVNCGQNERCPNGTLTLPLEEANTVIEYCADDRGKAWQWNSETEAAQNISILFQKPIILQDGVDLVPSEKIAQLYHVEMLSNLHLAIHETVIQLDISTNEEGEIDSEKTYFALKRRSVNGMLQFPHREKPGAESKIVQFSPLPGELLAYVSHAEALGNTQGKLEFEVLDGLTGASDQTVSLLGEGMLYSPHYDRDLELDNINPELDYSEPAFEFSFDFFNFWGGEE